MVSSSRNSIRINFLHLFRGYMVCWVYFLVHFFKILTFIYFFFYTTERCIFSELLCGKPLFQGTTEIDQLDKIFQLCGTPTEEDWPEITNLSFYSLLTPKQNYPRILTKNLKKNLNENFQKISEDAFDLLEGLLTVNPTKRLTAEQALSHKFFTFFPKHQCVPLDKYSTSCHELSSKALRKQRQHHRNPRESSAGLHNSSNTTNTSGLSGGESSLTPPSKKRKDMNGEAVPLISSSSSSSTNHVSNSSSSPGLSSSQSYPFNAGLNYSTPPGPPVPGGRFIQPPPMGPPPPGFNPLDPRIDTRLLHYFYPPPPPPPQDHLLPPPNSQSNSFDSMDLSQNGAPHRYPHPPPPLPNYDNPSSLIHSRMSDAPILDNHLRNSPSRSNKSQSGSSSTPTRHLNNSNEHLPPGANEHPHAPNGQPLGPPPPHMRIPQHPHGPPHPHFSQRPPGGDPGYLLPAPHPSDHRFYNRYPPPPGSHQVPMMPPLPRFPMNEPNPNAITPPNFPPPPGFRMDHGPPHPHFMGHYPPPMPPMDPNLPPHWDPRGSNQPKPFPNGNNDYHNSGTNSSRSRSSNPSSSSSSSSSRNKNEESWKGNPPNISINPSNSKMTPMNSSPNRQKYSRDKR